MFVGFVCCFVLFFPFYSSKCKALLCEETPWFTFGFIICDSDNHPQLPSHGRGYQLSVNPPPPSPGFWSRCRSALSPTHRQAPSTEGSVCSELTEQLLTSRKTPALGAKAKRQRSPHFWKPKYQY